MKDKDWTEGEDLTGDDLKELVQAFSEVEWAHVTWSDYSSCPFCSALWEDKRGHDDSCRWQHIMNKWKWAIDDHGGGF